MNKELLKEIIGGLLIENGNFKLIIRNRGDKMTEKELNDILDQILKNEEIIDVLRTELRKPGEH